MRSIFLEIPRGDQNSKVADFTFHQFEILKNIKNQENTIKN
jgi:hypothetical protein